MAKDNREDGAPIEIKKYANRRLYNTSTSSYITLDALCEMVKDGQDFVVRDAKSGDDITRSVLTQIIFEQEAKGQNLLPITFLRDLIKLYDDNLNQLVPNYLEMSMQAFSSQQDDLRKYFDNGMNPMLSMSHLEELGRRNMEMMQHSMGMMNPFFKQQTAAQNAPANNPAPEAKPEPATENANELDALRQQMAAMQSQLEKLSQKD